MNNPCTDSWNCCFVFLGAIALGYANIFVTAPSPENLRTLFEFVFKGLDACGYQEHIDYDLVESTNPDWGRAVVRVNVFRAQRQVGNSLSLLFLQPLCSPRGFDVTYVSKRCASISTMYVILIGHTPVW
jgi:tRNA(Met) C34 N-acetyltransferase TmcA